MNVQCVLARDVGVRVDGGDQVLQRCRPRRAVQPMRVFQDDLLREALQLDIQGRPAPAMSAGSVTV